MADAITKIRTEIEAVLAEIEQVETAGTFIPRPDDRSIEAVLEAWQ